MATAPVYRVHPSFVINRTKELAIQHARILDGDDGDDEDDVGMEEQEEQELTTTSGSTGPLVLTSRVHQHQQQKQHQQHDDPKSKMRREAESSDLYRSLIPDETIPRVVVQPDRQKRKKVLAFPIAVNRVVRKKPSVEMDGRLNEMQREGRGDEIELDEKEQQNALEGAEEVGKREKRKRKKRGPASFMLMRSYHDAALNAAMVSHVDNDVSNNENVIAGNATGNGVNDDGTIRQGQSRRPTVLFRDPMPHEITIWKQLAFALLAIVDTAVIAYLIFANRFVEQIFKITQVQYPEGNNILEQPLWAKILVWYAILPILFVIATLINIVGSIGMWKKSLRTMTFYMCCIAMELLLSILYMQSYFDFARVATLLALYIFSYGVQSKLMSVWYQSPVI